MEHLSFVLNYPRYDKVEKKAGRLILTLPSYCLPRKTHLCLKESRNLDLRLSKAELSEWVLERRFGNYSICSKGRMRLGQALKIPSLFYSSGSAPAKQTPSMNHSNHLTNAHNENELLNCGNRTAEGTAASLFLSGRFD